MKIVVFTVFFLKKKKIRIQSKYYDLSTLVRRAYSFFVVAIQITIKLVA